MEYTIFTARAYARAVLRLVILSVHLSVTCMDCDKTKWCTADILIPHERAITLLLDTNSGWWATPVSLWNIRRKWRTAFEKRRLGDINMFYAEPASYILQVVVPAWPISPCFSRLTNSYGVSGVWPALHRTTGSADNCTMNFLDVGTAHTSHWSLP